VAVYSIKDLEKLSGIKAHTLRIWEQRYKIIEPKRTATNIRYYTDEDLRHLINIALLNKNGYKISRIAALKPEEVNKLTARTNDFHIGNNTVVDTLSMAMLEYDEGKFDKIWNANVEQHGVEHVMNELINPFLEKLSIMWMNGSVSVAQGHFITSLIRRKLFAAIDSLPVDENIKGKPSFLLYLPPGESQELSLLFAQYLIRSRGFCDIFLGSGVDSDDLRSVFTAQRPAYFFTIMSDGFQMEPPARYLQRLTADFPGAEFWVTGYQLLNKKIQLPPNVRVISDIQKLVDMLDRLGRQAIS
jgi:DNA-binding transcriptional MerR regulator